MFFQKRSCILIAVLLAAGCTALESFYQSIRQPLQYLPMGDPLAAPFKPKGEVLVEGLEPSIYDERIDAGEPVPAYVYVRLFLGELAVDED